MTQEDVNSLLERPKPNYGASSRRIAELEAALIAIKNEVYELPCSSCGISDECFAHDQIRRIESAINRVDGGNS